MFTILTPLCLSSRSPSLPPAKHGKHCVDPQEVLSGSRGPDQGDPVQGKKWGKEVQSERQKMRKKGNLLLWEIGQGRGRK